MGGHVKRHGLDLGSSSDCKAGRQTPGRVTGGHPTPGQMSSPNDIRPLGERPHLPSGSPMLRSRLLISVLFVAFSLGPALLKPLTSRADNGAPPTPARPDPVHQCVAHLSAIPGRESQAQARASRRGRPSPTSPSERGSSTTRSGSAASATSTAAARPDRASIAPASFASSTGTSASPSPTRATRSSAWAAGSAGHQ